MVSLVVSKVELVRKTSKREKKALSSNCCSGSTVINSLCEGSSYILFQKEDSQCLDNEHTVLEL